MTKVHFFELTFQQHDQNSPNRSELHRILAGDKVFYAYSRQFVCSKLFRLLQPGDKIYVAAHLLIDGTYWLHWLYSSDKGVLELKEEPINERKVQLKLFVSILTIFVSVYYCLTLRDFFATYLLIMLLFFLGYTFYSYLRVLKVSRHRSIQCLKAKLNLVKQGDLSFFVVGDTVSPRDNTLSNYNQVKLNDLDHLQPDDLDRLTYTDLATTLNGEAKGVCVIGGSFTRRVSTGIRGTASVNQQQKFLQFTFSCCNKPFTLRLIGNVFSKKIHPIYYQHHPVFLADNDLITLIINPENNEVIGLANEIDNSAYLKGNSSSISLAGIKGAYIGVFCTYLFGFLITLISEVKDLWAKGQIDIRDWSALWSPLKDLSLMFFIIFCIFLLFIEIINLIVRTSSINSVRLAFARHLLITYLTIGKKPIIIQEVL